MKICPITYEVISETQKYSEKGLKKLAPGLTRLEDLPFSAAEQRLEAIKRAQKMSIQGVQLKLSAKLNIKEGRFEFTDTGGKFILKPQNELYPELPENEDVTMRLAETIDIEVPVHGLIYSKDRSFTYFIKRFDRVGHNQKVAVEDFAQLSGKTRDTKYNFSTERLISIIENFCTFPVVEKAQLFKRTLFNYLTGNEDMHLKNYSLIRRNEKVELAPAYDFLNTTIVLGGAAEELALPLKGKKHNLRKKDFLEYFALEKLELSDRVVQQIVNQIQQEIPQWQKLIEISFLSPEMKKRYLDVLGKRVELLLTKTLDL